MTFNAAEVSTDSSTSTGASGWPMGVAVATGEDGPWKRELYAVTRTKYGVLGSREFPML